MSLDIPALRELIAAARSALPAALDEIERLTALLNGPGLWPERTAEAGEVLPPLPDSAYPPDATPLDTDEPEPFDPVADCHPARELGGGGGCPLIEPCALRCHIRWLDAQTQPNDDLAGDGGGPR